MANRKRNSAGAAVLLAAVIAGGSLVAAEVPLGLQESVAGRADVSAEMLPDWAGLLEHHWVQLRYGHALWDGAELVVLEDNISDGRAVDMSTWIDVKGGPIVENDTVTAAHDLGNAYVLARRDGEGQLVLHAGVELLDPSYGIENSYLELEFNQQSVQAIGVSRPLRGERNAGDLLVRLHVLAGGLGSVEFLRWDGRAFSTIESGRALTSGSCSVETTPYFYCDGGREGRLLEPNRDLYDAAGVPVVVPATDRFLEIGLHAGALIDADVEFSAIQLRTAQDILLGSFNSMGSWAERRNAERPAPIDSPSPSRGGVISTDDSSTWAPTEEN
ncbi:MAG: hypothetical protein OER90_17240 [Gemmatimonadota bacterium]|nr:hypothetical protein [Gemmatimonadota bacterium]